MTEYSIQSTFAKSFIFHALSFPLSLNKYVCIGFTISLFSTASHCFILLNLYFFSYFNYLFYLVLPQLPISEPCVPSPCGPYSQCRVVNGHAVCSCQTDYIGTPPACRPECMVSADCPQDKACINTKCKDPCPGTCGLNARCNVVNHNPICSCALGFTGDPFVRCLQEESKIVFPKFLRE